MTREELIAYDRWLTENKWGSSEIITPEQAADLYLAKHPLPPAEGADQIRQLLLGWEHYKRDHFRESEALDVEAILMSEYSQIAARQQPTAEGAEEILANHIDKESMDELSVNVWPDMLEAMQEYATLHAQRIAEKMVEDELRKFVPPEENFPDFDESKKSDPSYCVEWGMLKQRNIERQIWNKAINNLKSRDNGNTSKDKV